MASPLLATASGPFGATAGHLDRSSERIATDDLNAATTVPVRLIILGYDEDLWRERVDTVSKKLPWVALDSMLLNASPAGARHLLRLARDHANLDVIAGVPGTTLANLVREGLVRSLGTWIRRLDLLPTMQLLATYDQSLVALPLSGYPVFAVFNPRAFDAAGITEPGETYDDWLDTARRLTDHERYAYGWGVVADTPEIETIVRSSGSTFASGATVTPSSAWQWYADLVHIEGISPPPFAWDGLVGTHAALKEGLIAMTMRSAWILDELSSHEPPKSRFWQLAPLPCWSHKDRVVPVRADYAAVTSNSLVADIASTVAATLATDAWFTPRARGVPAWRPALEQVATSHHLQTHELTESSDNWHRPSLETPEAELTQSLLLPAIDDVMASGEPVRQRMQDLARDLLLLSSGGVV